jgi:hydrogenase-4 component F
MAFLLILFPALLAGVALILPWSRLRPWLLPVGATGHLAGTIALLVAPDLGHWDKSLWLLPDAPGRLVLLLLSAPECVVSPDLGHGDESLWRLPDAPGRLVLLLLSALFNLCAWYAAGYLQHRQERPNRVFCACVLTLLSSTTLVACSQHLAVMWVAIEGSTLATAPLIYFNRTPRSIEATWKYLLIGSVGVALSLLGSFFLAYSAVGRGPEPTLFMEDLLKQAAQAPGLALPWLQAAFVLLLVGYGTKMGLAPMHTWKPDAYGEAPGVVGALLAGGLTSCAFLILVRVHHLCAVAGIAAYVDRTLVFMGLFSMAVAGVFMVNQRDFKRMLAYSSVEHMGILALGLGLGGAALYGALLHMVNNSITKGVLFLSAGNIHRAYGDKTTDTVRGAMRRLPLSGTLFLLGFFAVTGSPPFGPFVSEFTILNGAFAGGRYIVAGLFLLFLLVVFLGMGRTVLAVVQGRPPAASRRTPYRDGLLTGLPILVSAALVLLLGVYIPAPLNDMLREAARFLEVKP